MIVRAVPPADRLDGDGASLLLYEGRVVKLGPLGAAILDLAADPVSLAILAAELERRFGSPATGSTAEATAQAVSDLVEIGVLERLDGESTQAPDELE